MPDVLPTVKIDAPDRPRGFRIINASDFDPEVHALHGADSAATIALGAAPAAVHQIDGMTKVQITEALGSLGVEYDGRLGAQKLRDLLTDAVAANAAAQEE